MSEVYPDSKDQRLELIQRWPTPRSKSWTASFLDSTRNDENIVAVIGIGSAVRLAVSSVDIDLVVICRETAKFKDKPPIEIDLRAYAADQVDTLIESGNDLLGWAITYGRVLWQRDRYWDMILKSWRHRVPLPSAEVSTRRANEALHRFRSMLDLGDQDAAYELAVSYVTHLARAELLKRGQYPASRPELSGQLRAVGCAPMADWVERLISRTAANSKQLSKLLESMPTYEEPQSISPKRSSQIQNKPERRLHPSRRR